MVNRGRFISFEGGEGAGKSTQVALLEAALTSRAIKCLTTREPGGSPGAEEIRNLLVKGDLDRWDPICEALLHFTARRHHVTKVIEPALRDGTWVICDRYTDSTVAYQGYGQGLNISWIEDLHRIVAGDLWPDLTIILDVPVKDGFDRISSRRSGDDRYERMDSEFHSRLRRGFLDIAKNHSKRCRIIDSSQSVEDVHNAVLDLVQEQLCY